MELPLNLIAQRNADSTLTPLEQVISIDQIKNDALAFSTELLRPAMGVIEDQQQPVSTNSGSRRIVRQNSQLIHDPLETDISARSSLFKYDSVCIGGTFDHMHLGHRLLLTQACLVTKTVLHVGVTSDALLTKKAYKQFIEPYDVRVAYVKDFLDRIAPDIQYVFFELSDPVGIAGDLPEL